MRLKSLNKLFILSILTFFLGIGNNLVYAQDNLPSPLFKESLQETLNEFTAGTKKFNANFPKKQIKIVRNTDASSRHIKLRKKAVIRSNRRKSTRRIKKTTLSQGLCGEPACFRPTFSGSHTCWKSSTCRGIRCICCPKLPTLCGITCSVTCGRRSTCAGCICRYFSPCAKVHSPERVARNSEKPYTFTLF